MEKYTYCKSIAMVKRGPCRADFSALKFISWLNQKQGPIVFSLLGMKFGNRILPRHYIDSVHQ